MGMIATQQLGSILLSVYIGALLVRLIRARTLCQKLEL